jgi:hypothetical protein
MKKKIVFVIMTGLIIASVRVGKTDEIDQQKESNLKQIEQIQQLQQRVLNLEAKLNAQESEGQERISGIAENKQSKGLPGNLKWLEKIKLSADFRYRHELIDQQGKKKQNRHRIRARLGLEAQVDDEWGIGFRIASGSADPVSTNQTLEDSFSSKELWLDLAYFRWHPKLIKGSNILGGKIKNPFYKVGDNQLIWDSDLNPEGIAGQYKVPFGTQTELQINGGGFWVDESAAGVDTLLWGIQGYLKYMIGNPDYVLGGVGYYDYSGIKGRGDLKSTWSSSSSFYGNTTSAGVFASDYDIFEAFAEFGTELMGLPIAVYGDWAKNMAASTGKDTGWLIGGRINKAKERGSWELSYDYRDLKTDAVLGAFTDSDFIGGGTGGKGHRFGFAYQLAKNVQAAVTYFDNEIHRSTSIDYKRLQIDLNLKF